MLAYPDYNEPFEIFMDASTRQLGAVITQKGRPLAFFSRKLNAAQEKYTVTELELLSIVECFKEFTGMLWGQKIKVFTDHKTPSGLVPTVYFAGDLPSRSLTPKLSFLRA